MAERQALGLPQGLRARLRAALRILRLAVEDGSARPLGAWLAGYLEEVAARPRGAAVPRARPGR